MKDLTLLIIPGCFAALIVLLLAAVFQVGPFAMPLPPLPVSMVEQCQQTGKWCLGATCGGCNSRGRPGSIYGTGL